MTVIPVIIPIYNRIATTKIGLNSIYDSVLYARKNIVDVKFELIVVDDGSTDGSKEWIQSTYSDVHVVIGKGDWWWTGSVNRGIEYALSKFKDDLLGVVLQNDDVLVEKDWLTQLYEIVLANGNALIGCAAADINNKTMLLYGGRVVNPWSAKFRSLNVGKSITEIDTETLVEASDLIGRGIFIPVEVTRKLGLFDEKHFKHRGDTELPVRAKKAGHKLLVTYKALVYINPETTSTIDIKNKYTWRDFKSKFFDFRSSSYWEYRYYYAKYQSNNIFQQIFFFTCDMGRHFVNFISRM